MKKNDLQKTGNLLYETKIDKSKIQEFMDKVYYCGDDIPYTAFFEKKCYFGIHKIIMSQNYYIKTYGDFDMKYEHEFETKYIYEDRFKLVEPLLKQLPKNISLDELRKYLIALLNNIALDYKQIICHNKVQEWVDIIDKEYPDDPFVLYIVMVATVEILATHISKNSKSHSTLLLKLLQGSSDEALDAFKEIDKNNLWNDFYKIGGSSFLSDSDAFELNRIIIDKSKQYPFYTCQDKFMAYVIFGYLETHYTYSNNLVVFPKVYHESIASNGHLLCEGGLKIYLYYLTQSMNYINNNIDKKLVDSKIFCPFLPNNKKMGSNTKFQNKETYLKLSAVTRFITCPVALKVCLDWYRDQYFYKNWNSTELTKTCYY